MVRRPLYGSKISRQTLPEIHKGLRDTPEGQEVVRDTPGGVELVGRPSWRSGTGHETLPGVRK